MAGSCPESASLSLFNGGELGDPFDLIDGPSTPAGLTKAALVWPPDRSVEADGCLLKSSWISSCAVLGFVFLCSLGLVDSGALNPEMDVRRLGAVRASSPPRSRSRAASTSDC